ncbi:MAG: mandelate racemase/muconate lactonizing enzyme family protein [Geminicoccales bacterium]
MTTQIKNVIPRLIERDMGGKVWNPRTRFHKKQILLVFVEDQAGRLGLGECWLHSSTPRALIALIEDDLAPLVTGIEPHRIGTYTEQLRQAVETSNQAGITAAAWSGIEMAVHDLRARQLDLGLADLLGRCRDEVLVYASAGLYGEGKTPDDLAAEVKGWADQGFDAVKIKVGGALLAEDVRRVAAVREAIGSDVRLMVDALYNYDVAEALRFAHAVAPYDIAFLEAPVSPSDVEGQAEVHQRSPIPICGNETLAWTAPFRELITRRATHWVQFDLGACGGIQEGRRIAELAHAFHLPATLHAASSAVLFAASLHLAASLPNAHSVEFHMLHQWLWDRAPKDIFKACNGMLLPPPGPGHGITLDPDSLDA